jgi:diguanylate cyclase (GGDEF)-like protein/PAS domain S-box-containing protein
VAEARIGVFITDERGHCRYANPEFQRMVGRPLEAILGKGWVETIPPEDRPRVLREWNECTACGGRYQSEHRLVRADGTVGWVGVRASNMSVEGRSIGYAGIVEDVTARRQAEEALRRGERMVRDVAEASLDAFFVFEPYLEDGEVADFRFAYVSRHAELLFGHPDAEVRGARLSVVFPQTAAVFLPAYRRVLQSGEPFEIEVPAGGPLEGRYVHVRASRVADGVGVAVRDVTELRRLQAEAEARTAELEALNDELRESSVRIAREHALLDAMLETAGCLVCVADQGGRIVRFNAECERVTGWTEGELLGRRVYDHLIPPEARPGVAAVFASLRQEPFPVSHENEWVTKSGDRRLIHWRNTALLDSEGHVEYLIGTGIDITERQAAEDELRSAKEALDLAQRISGVGSWEVEIGTGRDHWSAGMFEIFGLPQTEAPSFAAAMRHVHPEDAPKVAAALERARTECIDAAFEFRVVIPGGRERHVKSLCKADRAHGRLFGTVMDVTDRVLWQRQLEDAMLRTVAESVQLEVQQQELIQLNQRLDRLAVTDGLTEVLNHRAFQERLDEEIERARRAGTAVSLLLLDVDHFKSLNDEHGHQEGDRVLKGLATTLRSMARATDVVARYGGEEFVVILSGANADAARTTAERMRNAITTQTDGRRRVTASFGIATFRGGTDSKEEFIRRADTALYEAKRQGRNRALHYDVCGTAP